MGEEHSALTGFTRLADEFTQQYGSSSDHSGRDSHGQRASTYFPLGPQAQIRANKH